LQGYIGIIFSGVPVAITDPGSSVVNDERYSMMVGMSKIISQSLSAVSPRLDF
jgi:hypothetical protein